MLTAVFFALTNLAAADFTVLHSFSTVPTDGTGSWAPLTVIGNSVYGTTIYGGANDGGNVFKMNRDGTDFELLHSFAYNPLSGGPAQPHASLNIEGTGIVGTTYAGGTQFGTIFTLNTDGTGFQTTHNFTGAGSAPEGGLIKVGTKLYGADSREVYSTNLDGSGFSIVAALPAATDLANGDLLLRNNMLYGTGTDNGLFAMRLDGSGVRTLKTFSGENDPIGSSPLGGMINVGTTLYGVTALGGAHGEGVVFKATDLGSFFLYDVLHSFGAGATDGAFPHAGLVASNGKLYGTTEKGGTDDLGTIFSMNLDGSGFTLLHSFNGSNGAQPLAKLTLVGSTLYGTTNSGGAFEAGTVFALTVPEPAPVQLAAMGGLLLLAAEVFRRRWRSPHATSAACS